MAVYNAESGRLQVLVTGVSLPLPLLTDGAIVTVHLTGRAGSDAQVASIALTDVSLGSEQGESVHSDAGSPGDWLPNKIFLPLVAAQQ